MAFLNTLRNKFRRWLMARLIAEGFAHLKGEHLGDKLQAALEKNMGMRSQQFRTELGDWLIQLGQEVKT